MSILPVNQLFSAKNPNHSVLNHKNPPLTLHFINSTSPILHHINRVGSLCTQKEQISELKNMKEKDMATICGLITSVRKIPTKKDPSKFIIIANIEDLTEK